MGNLYFCRPWTLTSAWYLVLHVSSGYKIVVLNRDPIAPDVASDKDSISTPIFLSAKAKFNFSSTKSHNFHVDVKRWKNKNKNKGWFFQLGKELNVNCESMGKEIQRIWRFVRNLKAIFRFSRFVFVRFSASPTKLFDFFLTCDARFDVYSLLLSTWKWSCV